MKKHALHGALAAVALTAVSQNATAQTVPERLSLHLEGGVGSMLSPHQIDAGFGVAGQVGARLAMQLFEPFAVQLAFSSWSFPNATSGGGEVLLGAGIRFEPEIGTIGRLFVDGDVGAALSGSYAVGPGASSGSLSRTMIDLGFGFEFAATRWLGIGPELRYGRVMAQDAHDFPSDAQFFSLGLSVSLRLPRAVPPPPPPTPPPAPPAPPAPPPPPPDPDADGVPDPVDACPTDPAGEHPDPSRAGCPDGDDDHDGVSNHVDACPTDAAGDHPDPARAGCPLPDGDHDAVPDATDACPVLPGGAPTGCPAFLAPAQDGALALTPVIAFVPYTARIAPASDAVLTQLAALIHTTTGVQTLSIEAHTDEGGARAQALSQQRAQAVMAWLVAHGVEAARLEAHGYGTTRPLVPGTTPAIRAQNRRVEVRVTAPAATTPGTVGGAP